MSVADPDAALASSLATALVPHFRDALQKSCAEEAAVLTLVAMSQGAALAAPTMETDGAKHVVRREITCMTYLRRLHVTAEMADELLPDMTTYLPQETMRAQSNRSFFKRELTVVDTYKCPHTVTYECLVSSGQRHARLSAGWGTLMRKLNAQLGDTVVLALRGDRNDGVLHVGLERRVVAWQE